MFHKLITSPKIIAPFLIVASFLTTVFLQLAFEQSMMAGEVKALSTTKKLLEDQYPKLLEEAKAKGFKQDPNKPGLLVNFWASWCKPCIKEFQSMDKLLNKTDNLEILGVNQDDTDREMNKVIKRRKLKFFSYRDDNTARADAMGVEEYPYTVFYCRGKVKAIYQGATDFVSHKVLSKLKTCLKN